MASLKSILTSAKENIAGGSYKEALQHCKAALKLDKASYEAYLLIGKAAFLLGEREQAALAYFKAVQLNANLLPAWKGLVELHGATDDAEGLADALEHLLSLSEEAAEKVLGYRKRLAGAYIRLSRSAKASELVREILKDATKEDRDALDLLCKLADLQEADGTGLSAPEQYADTLQAIVNRTEPTLEYKQYHERWLSRQLAVLPPYSQGSTEWLEKRKALLERCCTWAGIRLPGTGRETDSRTISRSSHVVLEAALSLLGDLTTPLAIELPHGIPRDQAESLKQQIACTLAHAFPWRSSARVAIATQLLGQLLENTERPTKTSECAKLAQAMADAGLAAAGNAAAWQALAELQLKSGRVAAAVSTCAKGLAFLGEHEALGRPSHPEVMLGLRLAAAEADIALGRLAEADIAFRGLAEESKVIADGALATQQRLRALQGLAASASARGDARTAQTLYKHLLGQASDMRGFRGQVLSDYGWSLFQDGNHEAAKLQLEEGVRELAAAGGAVTGAKLGEAHFRLGRTCWELGAAHQADRDPARRHWMAAAALEGPEQAAAFAWLGRFFEEAAADLARAQRCYQRALALDPLQASAGEALCRLLRRVGAADKALKLSQEVVARSPAALWAWQRSGRLLHDSGEYQQAVVALQTALRGDASAAGTWEALGATYQALGRLSAAIKAYGQAVFLQPKRVYSHVQAGIIQLSLGAHSEALAAFQAALALDSGLIPAHLGAGEALLVSAKRHMAMGALGIAAKELKEAERHALHAAGHPGNIRAAWKLLGDVQLAHNGVTPRLQSREKIRPGTAALGDAQELLRGWGLRVKAVRSSRRSYAKALHLAPWESAQWGDLAASFQVEAALRHAHAALQPQDAFALQAQAERLIRGGLRLDATSAALWAALGSASGSRKAREYALGRALQLDPKLVPAWVALGRLYVDAGETGLAGRCFATARSQEPTAAATWEGMGALEALSTLGASARVGYYEHAVRLGAGKEALLGYVEGALRNGQGHQGSIHAAACRVAELDPMNPSAQHALGLVLECRGAYDSAAAAFQRALDLVEAARRSSGKAAPNGALGNVNSELATAVEVNGDHPPSMDTAMQMNLGRVLGLARRFEESASRFDELQFMQELDKRPLAQLAFVHALHGKGSSAAAERGLQALLRSPPDSQVHAESVRALCRQLIGRGDLDAALTLLDSHLGALIESRAPNAAVESALLALLAGAAKMGGPQDRAGVRGICARYAAAVDDAGGAEFVARQLLVEGCAARVNRRLSEAARLAAQAIHLCPWLPQLWGKLGIVRLQASAACAAGAGRACQHPGLDRLDGLSRMEAPEAEALRRAKAGRAAAVLAAPAGHDRSGAAAELKALKGWLHMEPHNPKAWLLVALLSLRCAHNTPSAQRFKSAARIIGRALQVVGAQNNKQGRDCILLACALSEAHLQLAALQGQTGSGGHDGALKAAFEAVDEAAAWAAQTGFGSALALSQRARCIASKGDESAAETSFREAIASASSPPECAMAVASFAAAAVQALSHRDSNSASAAAAAAVDLIRNAEARLQQSGEEELLEYLMLQRAMLVAASGDVHAAKQLAEAALALHCDLPFQRSGSHSAVQVVLGALHLKDALDSGSIAAVSEARHALAPVANACGEGASLAHSMLAEVESLGSARKKDERIQAHVQQAMRLAERPLSPADVDRCVRLSTSLPLACSAVHLQPWEPTGWARLVQ